MPIKRTMKMMTCLFSVRYSYFLKGTGCGWILSFYIELKGQVFLLINCRASAIMQFCFQQIMCYFFGELCTKYPQLCGNCTIILNKNFWCFNLLSLQIIFWYFSFKIIQSKKKGKEGVLLWNKSKQDAIFFFSLWLVIFLPIMVHLIDKITTASSIECLFATKQWLFAVKIYFYCINRKKFFMHLSRYEKKNIQ